ncbi:hypothetical protein ACV3UL_15420 [Clostridium perfringens]
MPNAKYIPGITKYIDFDIDRVNELSEMLFQRGEFGYVTSLLLSRLNNGDVDDFKETTKKVVAVNNLFGDAAKLNYTIGFLNTIRADRDSVAKYVAEMGFKEY